MIGYSTATYTRKCPVRNPKKCQSFQLFNYCLANRGQRTAHGPRTLITNGTLGGKTILAVSSSTEVTRTRHSAGTNTHPPQHRIPYEVTFFLAYPPPPFFCFCFLLLLCLMRVGAKKQCLNWKEENWVRSKVISIVSKSVSFFFGINMYRYRYILIYRFRFIDIFKFF